MYPPPQGYVLCCTEVSCGHTALDGDDDLMGDDALYESQIIALLDEVESKATLNFFFIFQTNTVHYTQYTILQYEWVSNLGFVCPVNHHFL